MPSLVAIALALVAANEPVEYASPSWSPDGAWIAFAANFDGRWRLHAVRPDGTDLKRLSQRHPVGEIAWSPDGPQIAFDCACGTLDRSIFILDASSGEERELTPEPGWHEVANPRWSPSGTRMSYLGRRQLEDGSRRTGLVVRHVAAGGAAWSIEHATPILGADFIDEGRMLLSGALDGEAQLWLYDDQRASLSRLVAVHGYYSGIARVGPSGERVAFNRAPVGGEAWEIALYDLARSELRQLTNTIGDNAMPAWDPQEERIVYQTTRNGRQELMIMDLADGAEVNLSARIADHGDHVALAARRTH